MNNDNKNFIKERVIHIRVHNEDYIALRNKAQKLNMTVSELMRLQMYKLLEIED
jgi:hypothetical protein